MASAEAQLFLLSWTQLQHALWLSPGDEVYGDALRAVEEQLARDYGITGLSLVTRSLDGYTVSFTENGSPQILRFSGADVEEFA